MCVCVHNKNVGMYFDFWYFDTVDSQTTRTAGRMAVQNRLTETPFQRPYNITEDINNCCNVWFVRY